MEILLNGEAYQLPPEIKTIAELVESLELQGKRLAVEHNQEIVPKSDHATTQLCANDRVEIVHAIGGG
ncbi:MAG: thiamine biosynthesis protein ThiS [Kangiellaceae bacterium]|jgi:sulfur carrier protein|nr:thiamine biosynthesis protein ThiS [Kangiellaceae bacterium]|tara:strand:- start:6467 stop:6670 length:204 start_codon:yes stop_codon:yes gene_type:complete